MAYTSWILVAVTAAAGLALAAAAPPPGPTLDEIIAARQASLDMSSITLAEMKEAAKGGRDPKTQVYDAAALARWAKALPTLFPVGTGIGTADVATKAKPEIWTDRAGFEVRAAEYAAATTRLRDLARAGDVEGFKAQIRAVDMACDACHDTYKVQPAASAKATS